MIPKSGLYIPNKFARISLLAFEDVLGKNGLNVILNRASLSGLIDQNPPDDLERSFDFSDYSMILQGLEEMYGFRGGRGLALRAGRAMFNNGLKNFGALAGVEDPEFQILPFRAKQKIALTAVARIFTSLSDQTSSVEEEEDHYNYIMHACPQCWGRTTDQPSCFIGLGLLQACMSWISGGSEFQIQQTAARSCGDALCSYSIPKISIG